ncbi:unnamed protein product [Rhizoctonia solani]|uniref:Uncharacterized protein n=1 Tax=Rhizoctonia solani TaxID=456999 RepID=A0A8H2X8R4_9AGAM|nr:unnamed protein product [Rhizoctonia solani]
MQAQEQTPVEASQASNDTAHALAAANLMSSQASSISDFTQASNRRPRSASADPRARYNTPGSVPASSTRRGPKSRSSSIASNHTFPGESQLELAGHYSRPNTPTGPRPIPDPEDDNTLKRRQPSEAQTTVGSTPNTRTLRETVVDSIVAHPVEINVAVAGNIIYLIGHEMSRELKKIHETTPFDSSIKLDIVNNFIQETERLLAVIKADFNYMAVTPQSTQASQPPSKSWDDMEEYPREEPGPTPVWN